MKISLFDALSGGVGADRSPGAPGQSSERFQSIIRNLTHLLNTRRGSVGHLPDYGLPDLGSLYRGMPDSVDELRRTVQETIEKYEPRLSRVRVKVQVGDTSTMRLPLILTAEMDGERVRLVTTFSSRKLVEVGSYTERD